MLDFLDLVQTLDHLAETRVIAVQMCSVLAVVHNEELRTAGISPSVRHGQNPFVVVLIVSVEFAIDGVTWATASNPLWTATLGHEARNDAVKFQALIESVLRELHEIRHGFGRIVLEKFHGHGAVISDDFSLHAAKIARAI